MSNSDQSFQREVISARKRYQGYPNPGYMLGLNSHWLEAEKAKTNPNPDALKFFGANIVALGELMTTTTN